jgi:MinD superfamily P-loop ATPase
MIQIEYQYKFINMNIAIVDLTSESVRTEELREIALGYPAQKTFFVDGEVKSPKLHTIFEAEKIKTIRVRGTKTGKIDNEPCIACLLCREECEFDAILEVDGYYHIDEEKCNGCGKCAHVCPLDGIKFDFKDAGMLSVYENDRETLISTELDEIAQDTGALLARGIRKAKLLSEDFDSFNIIVYFPHETGCFHEKPLQELDGVVILTDSNSNLETISTFTKVAKRFNKAVNIINK